MLFLSSEKALLQRSNRTTMEQMEQDELVNYLKKKYHNFIKKKGNFWEKYFGGGVCHFLAFFGGSGSNSEC